MMRWLDQLFAPITRRKSLGNRGERVAVRYLRGRGYKILMCNFRTAGGGIDIIARKGDLLVFVEVKTRSSDQYFAPHRQVNEGKQRRLTRAARTYLAHYKDRQPPCRFDVISIVWRKGQEPEVEHIVNAFEAVR